MSDDGDGDDLTLYYLAGLAAPPVTPDELANLGERIRLGREASDELTGLTRTGRLTRTPAPYVASLRAKTTEGERAERELARRHRRLVIKAAERCRRKDDRSLDELVAAGHQGLLRAVAKYDDRRDFRFETYCGWWIRQAISGRETPVS